MCRLNVARFSCQTSAFFLLFLTVHGLLSFDGLTVYEVCGVNKHIVGRKCRGMGKYKENCQKKRGWGWVKRYSFVAHY